MDRGRVGAKVDGRRWRIGVKCWECRVSIQVADLLQFPGCDVAGDAGRSGRIVLVAICTSLALELVLVLVLLVLLVLLLLLLLVKLLLLVIERLLEVLLLSKVRVEHVVIVCGGLHGL